MSQKQIDELQEMGAHQAREIADLNAVVTRQWDEIDAVKARLQKILDKVAVIEDSVGDAGGAGASVKPPHY